MSLLLNPNTKTKVEQFIAQPNHSLLLIGPLGSGKPTLAKHIIKQLLGLKNIEASAYYTHIVPGNMGYTISIDEIRNLKHFLSLKTTGKGSIRRVVLIEDAETMTTEAQNALLKVLEEPPADTVIILTSSQPNQLLTTVVSRCRKLELMPITKEAAEKFFSSKNQTEVNKAFHLSGGQPGLMTALLDEDGDHPLKPMLDTAKRLVSQHPFERLTEVDNLTKDKTNLPTLLYALKQLYRAVLEQSAQHDKPKEVKTAYNALKTINRADELLRGKASPKLLLTDLFLHL